MTIYKVFYYYPYEDNRKIKIFIFCYSKDDEDAKSMIEYFVYEIKKFNNAYIHNILTYKNCNNDDYTYKEIKEKIFNYLKDNMLLTDNMEVRSFSTYKSNKYKLWENELHSSFIDRTLERTYDNIFEPLEISYYDKNIFEHNVNYIKKVNIAKSVNKFINYDI